MQKFTFFVCPVQTVILAYIVGFQAANYYEFQISRGFHEVW